MQTCKVIEVNDEIPPFNQDEWIGRNRKYPKGDHIPISLKYYIDGLLVIPDTVQDEYIPRGNLSVEDFIKMKLPQISYNLPIAKAEISFRKEAPNVLRTSALSTQNIPPLAWLNSLKDAFGQAVLDGKKSIVDPQYPGSQVPLWWISFWIELHNIHKIQQDWKNTMEWVEKRTSGGAMEHRKEAQLRKQAKAILSKLRWDERTDIPGADGISTSTFSFASYLSDSKMMGTDHINMMFAHLSELAERDPVTDSYVIIERLRFIRAVEKVACGKGGNGKSERWLARLEDKIRNRDVKATVLPAYMCDHKHWVTIRIDFEDEEISYGDSLSHKGMPPPKDIIKFIQSWLKKRFGKTYKNAGNSLSHGDQDDFTDCGILAANTAAHDIFGDSLWNPEMKDLHRVNWFVRLSEAHINYVNKSDKYIPYGPVIDSAMPFVNETLPACNPQSLSHLLNPAPNPGQANNNGHSFSHLLNTAPDTTQAGNQAFQNAPPNGFEPMDVDPPSQADAECALPALCHVQLEVESSVDFGEANGLPGSDESTMSTTRDGGENKKRTASDDNEITSRKGPKLDQGYQDLRETLSFRRGLQPIAKSTLWSRIQNRRFLVGDFVPSSERDLKFRNRILALDPNSTILDPKTVRHFKCAKELKMKEPYNTGNFRKHIESCKGTPKYRKLPAGGMKTLDNFFAKRGSEPKVSNLSSKPSITFPCPGLRETSYPKILDYLERTGAHGGGSPSVSSLASELFGKKYRNLSKSRKRQVKIAQRHEWLWRNHHTEGAVYSTKCMKEAAMAQGQQNASSSTSSSDPQLLPCENCNGLFKLKAFNNVLQKPRPDDKNYKYTNIEYRNEKLASLFGRCTGLREIIEDKSNSPMVRYCKGVASGKYKGDDMFGLLLQAVVIKKEKEVRNIGMQNTKYVPDLVELAHVIHTHSAKAYDALKEFLPLPNPRTIKLHRSHQPRFPIGIQERTFALVIQKLNELQYNGPVALSCDDTKLLASLRPYYDQDREGYFLIGHVGQPLQLLDHAAFRTVVNENKLEKATKLRLWCIQIPLPKISTIIVAAESIPENLCAEDLLQYLWEIISGFLTRDIHIASYAADGSNVERAVQRLLEERASSTVKIAIKHPYNGHGAKDFVINLPFFGKQPIATLQDPKHLLKTFRNNLFSGARLLTFPTSIATFSQVRKIAAAPDSPIYIRDVEKLDRQDDNAATRLFSGATLEWLSKNHPEHLGLIVYLFICGEVIDAYQNRSLSLSDRVQLILRAHFFIELWEKFLDVSKYPKSRHYVSPQCADITRTLIHGFLQVVIIYRDYTGGARPLLPWLLSTEVIEHVFGLCRQIVKDFNMLDFHYMVPKLFVKLRQAVLSSKFSDGKARASGYNHTYADSRGIDIIALSTYPTNNDINNIAVRAYGEAESLFALLGVTASDLFYESAAPARLPAIGTWLIEDIDELFGQDDSELGINDIGTSDSGERTDDYQLALDLLEDADDDVLPQAKKDQLKGYRYASIALSIEERAQISSMLELEDDEMDEAFSEDAEQISHVLSMCGNEVVASLPPVDIDEHNNCPFNAADPSNIDLSVLTTLRFQHQTKQAATGVRTSKLSHSKDFDETAPSGKKELTDRQAILKGFSEIIREQGEKGIGTGADRLRRWSERNPAPGGRLSNINGVEAPELAAGNSANAVAVADANAKRALKRRTEIFKKFCLPDALGDGRITSISPLRIVAEETTSSYGGYGIAVSPTLNQFVVCKVKSIYAKTGGKNGRHNNVTDSSNIMAISYLTVQIFEHQLGTQFRAIPHAQRLQVLRFDHLPPSAFLCALKHAPELTPFGLKISLDDWQLFKAIKDNSEKVSQAIKVLAGRQKMSEDEE